MVRNIWSCGFYLFGHPVLGLSHNSYKKITIEQKNFVKTLHPHIFAMAFIACSVKGGLKNIKYFFHILTFVRIENILMAMTK